jgi:predicted AAA+ superfamily ATPase
MKNRIQLKELTDKTKSALGRIIILTGARQTGKTT